MNRNYKPKTSEDYAKLAQRFAYPCDVRYLKPYRRYLKITPFKAAKQIGRAAAVLSSYEDLTRMMPHEEFDDLTEYYCRESLNRGIFAESEYKHVMSCKTRSSRIQSASFILKRSLTPEELYRWKRDYLQLKVPEIVEAVGGMKIGRFYDAMLRCPARALPIRERIMSFLNKMETRERKNASYDIYYLLNREVEYTLDEVTE